MRHMLRTCLVLALAGIAAPAIPASKAVSRIMEAQYPDVCDGASGKLNPAGIIERDLTGDGKADLILDIGTVDCGNGMNMYCGSAGCSISVYVWQKGRLKEKLSLLGAGIEVMYGDPPGLRLTGADGGDRTYRWQGGEFR